MNDMNESICDVLVQCVYSLLEILQWTAALEDKRCFAYIHNYIYGERWKESKKKRGTREGGERKNNILEYSNFSKNTIM